MDEEEVSPLEKDHSLSVVLPGGMEKNATVHGSKPVMDFVVTLCASYHLNPSDYTIEVLSPNKNNISFKPNSPIGSLEAEKIVLKPKETEEKIRMPYMPEATVRLLINYNKSRKAVVRVNPRLPLEMLLPMVCDKCEFQVESTVLLRDSESKELLDLSRTLNEHGLREVFAKDTEAKDCTGHQHPTAAAVTPTRVPSSSSLQDLTKKEKKKSENKGFLGLFRKQRKKSEPDQAVSAPTSPGLTKQRSTSVSSTQGVTSCIIPPADMPKKRRAPQPPMGASQSIPNNLGTCHLLGTQRCGENTLRSTKRRAPPPPAANHHQEVPEDTAKDSLNTLKEEKECEEPETVTPYPLLPPPPSPPQLHKAPDSHRPTIRGKDRSDARSALAKVLTSSLSTGMLVKRLKKPTSFPKMHNGTSCKSESEPSSENAIEIKSVLNSNLSTENEWEDSLTKKGFTTFKVVPSRKQSDAEPNQDVPEQEESEIEPYQTVEEATTKSNQDVPEQEESEIEPYQTVEEATTKSNQDVPEQEESEIEPYQTVEEATTKSNQDVPEQEESEIEPYQTVEEATTKSDQDVPEQEESEIELDQGVEEATTKIDQSVTEEVAESVSPMPCLDQSAQEVDTMSCSLPLGNQSSSNLTEVEDIVETPKQDEETSTDDLKEEDKSDQSHEKMSEEADLYVGDEQEVVVECHTELNTCDSKTCDEKVEAVIQEDEDSFPPPPPPVYFNEALEETSAGSPVSASQPSSRAVTNGHVCSNGEPPQNSHSPGDFVDKTASAPSRFAQVVAQAVHRSRLHSTGKTVGPQIPQDTQSTTGS